MKKKVGDQVGTLSLPSLDGTQFELSSLKGRPFMLSFFRFASCPFCNLRMHHLVTRFGELSPSGKHFTIVAIFDSTPENLREHATRHHAPFPVLADARGEAYRQYGIEHSVTGVIKGIVRRLPTLLYAMFCKGFLPLKINGDMTTMPADFLVDPSGTIRLAYYGRDEGDHLSFEDVKRFAHLYP